MNRRKQKVPTAEPVLSLETTGRITRSSKGQTTRSSKTKETLTPVRKSRRSSRSRGRLQDSEDQELIDCDSSTFSTENSFSISLDAAQTTLPGNNDRTKPSPLSSVNIDSPLISKNIDSSSDKNDSAAEAANIIPQPAKKAARRGLAKKNAHLLADLEKSSTHNALVYSQCISENFKKVIHSHSVSSDSAQTENINISTKDDTKSEVAPSERDSKNVNDDSLLLDDSDLLDSDITADNGQTSIVIRSPTPPPVKTPKPKRSNKKLTKALDALSKAKVRLAQRPTPRSGKKRKSLGNDVVFLGEEEQTEIVAKVRYLSTVHRLRMKWNEPFKVLVSKVSQVIQEEEQRITLYVNDQKLRSSENPKSVGLTVADIIECHCIRYDKEDDGVVSTDVINLVIRMSDRSKITMQADKRRPIQDLIQKFAAMKQLDPSTLVFSFDGEELDPTDTPSSLEMEDEDCIEVSY